MTGYCRMGDWCATRDRDGAPGPDEGRGLCWPDEVHGQHAIRSLTVDYVTLASMLAKDAGGSGTAGIPTNRAEAPIPLRLDIDSLVRRIGWVAGAAESAVREISRLADTPEQGVRPGVALARAVAVLDAHYSALLALRPVAYLPYALDDEDERISGSMRPQPVDVDGLWFVAELTGLHHKARSRIGLTRRRERRALPCPPRSDDPARPGGCSTPERPMRTLSAEIGGSTVECDNCGWSCSTADYDLYTISFRIPSSAGVSS